MSCKIHTNLRLIFTSNVVTREQGSGVWLNFKWVGFVMLSIVLTISTLAWTTGGVCVDRVGNKLFRSSCISCMLTEDRTRPWRFKNSTDVTWLPCTLKIRKVSLESTNCALTMHFYSGKHCHHPPSGNCETLTRISVLQAQMKYPLREIRHNSTGMNPNCFFGDRVRTTFPLGRTSSTLRSISANFQVRSYHVRNISFNLKGEYPNRIRALLEQITTRLSPLTLLCNQCSVSSHFTNQGRTFLKRLPGPVAAGGGILLKRNLRQRRDISGDFSASYAYFAYFSSRSTDVSSTPVTSANTRPSQSPQSVISLVWCPQNAVIDSSTIYLRKSAPGEQFRGTIVPVSNLTPMSRVDMQQPTLKMSPGSVGSTAPSLETMAKATSSNLSQLRTNTPNIFIYSSRLVSIVHSASNSSYAFITTWHCATVNTHSSSSSLTDGQMQPTTATSSPKSSRDVKVKWVMALAVTGGVIFAFILIIVLIALVRRYRRIQSLRRKAKQISYFNRYDCSSAWDEPFGGSRLSVFTLKNSKFDIDWDTPNEGKKHESKDDDFEGR